MLRNVFSYITFSLEDRSTDIINYLAMNNNLYIELTNKMIDVQNEIFEILSQDYQTLFYDYESLRNERDSLKNFVLYKQGIIDGTRIKNHIGSNV